MTPGAFAKNWGTHRGTDFRYAIESQMFDHQKVTWMQLTLSPATNGVPRAVEFSTVGKGRRGLLRKRESAVLMLEEPVLEVRCPSDLQRTASKISEAELATDHMLLKPSSL